MLRDVYWRQYPIDLLNDDKMAYIESLLPEEYRFAPYMFYITALKLADDNGIFDLEDGIIFARLMRVKSRALVFQIANLMRQYKVLYRLSDDTTLMQIADWTYSDKKVRTAEERRRIVADKIAKERAKKAAYSQEDFSTDGCAGKHNAVPQSESWAGKCNDIPQATVAESTAPEAAAPAPEAENTAPRQAFLGPDDDKKAKNVVNIQTDNTDSTLQEIQTTHTHTETQQATGYGPIESPPPAACQDTNAVGVENKQNQNTESACKNTDGDASAGEDISTLAEQALQEARKDVENSDTASLIGYLNEFFVKNCYGFKPKQSSAAINTLAGKILELSDDVNPPGTIAGLLCSEFKRMCDGQRSEYWKGQALLPSYMIKTRCWMELMQYAGKILASNKASNKFTKSWEKAVAEYEAEKEQISDAVRDEYVKYNINPDAPNANFQLLSAKSREQEELRKAKEIEAEAAAAENAEAQADIF